jgi:hypothetical protein
MIQSERRIVGAISATAGQAEAPLPFSELRKNLKTIIRSSGIGIGLGALTGLGA